MKLIGNSIYGMRIIHTIEKYPKAKEFDGFKGIIVWSRWDTKETQVLKGYYDSRGKYVTDDEGVINIDLNELQTGKEIANIIKDIAQQIDETAKIAIDSEIARIIEDKNHSLSTLTSKS